jgi:hypothetical protein
MDLACQTYPTEDFPVEIPDNELTAMLPHLRRNLEEASALEAEVSPFGLDNIPPIEPDPNLAGESTNRDFGINTSIFKFARLFRRLADRNPVAAKRELAAWRRDDDPIFGRLRIWAAGLPGLLDAEQAAQIIEAVSDRTFWGTRDRRDVLLVLARRWTELSPDAQKKLERRIRRGLPRNRHYDPEAFRRVRAYSIADFLAWLKGRGCTFTFDVDAEIESARAVIPNWTFEQGTHAADSLETRAGFVRTDTSFGTLADLPLDQLITTALAASERRHGFLEERNPYAGLCESKPVRVLAALARLKEPNDETKIAWTQFFYAGASRVDRPALTMLMARRLAQVPVPVLAEIVQPAASWLDTVAKRVYERDARAVMMIIDRLIEALLGTPPPVENTAHERDWMGSASNSVVGSLMRVLLADPTLGGVALNTSLPSEWKSRAKRLRALPGDQGRFCLVNLAGSLAWLFAHDPAWTETAVLSAMEGTGQDRDAALAGFFGNANIHGALFARLKALLLSLSSEEGRARERYEAQLASLCITAWCQKNESGRRLVSDDELRAVLVHCSIPMRTRILWHAQQFPIAEKLALLRDVWPLQLAARSAIVAGRLCMIAFEDDEHFPELVDAILPLVSPGDGVGIMVPPAASERQIFERYPEHALALLWAVLPIDSSKWPYSMDAVLQQLWKQSTRIRKDSRMVELMRRIGRSQ